jgi:glycosyltransferase involved in cell wall biosynthesis
MKEPLVSVCIPVFNGAPHLMAAVDSVLSQTWTDLELLVFDNASTDATSDLLAGIRDERVRVFRNPVNIGAEGNWNLALAGAHGKYVKLLPHDDTLEPDCLERQVQALEAQPAAVLTFCSRTVIDPGGRRLMPRSAPWSDRLVGVRKVVSTCLKAGTNVIGEPGAVLFRKAIAEQVGGFNGTIPYVIDLDYWIRLMAYGPAWCIETPLASFRVSSSQWTATIGRQQSRQFIAFMDRLHGDLRPGPLLRLQGRCMATLNGVLRSLFYRLLVKDC